MWLYSSSFTQPPSLGLRYIHITVLQSRPKGLHWQDCILLIFAWDAYALNKMWTKIVVQNIKGARARRHFPACIFSMCIAWPGCRREILGQTGLLGILFPLVHAMSSPSGQGSFGRCFPKVFWEKGPAPHSSPLSQSRRTMPEDPTPDSSFAKELEINQWDGRRWAPCQRHRPENKSLPMSVGFVGAFCPFFSVCWWDDNFVCLRGFFFQDPQRARNFGGRYNQLAIHQPSKHLGRVRVRLQPTDGQFFPSSPTFFFSFLGSFLEQDALAAPSFTSPARGTWVRAKARRWGSVSLGARDVPTGTAGVTWAMPWRTSWIKRLDFNAYKMNGQGNIFKPSIYNYRVPLNEWVSPQYCSQETARWTQPLGKRGENTDEHLISHRDRLKKLNLFPMEQTMNCKGHKIGCRWSNLESFTLYVRRQGLLKDLTFPQYPVLPTHFLYLLWIS